MKLVIEEHDKYQESEVIIRCASIDEKLQALIDQIHTYTISIKGKKENCSYSISLREIHYFETVDDQLFIYTADSVFEGTKKLYELEELLRQTNFLRISKSCIVNIDCLVHVKPLFDGKFIATTNNGEELVVNRHYVKAFKEGFGL